LIAFRERSHYGFVRGYDSIISRNSRDIGQCGQQTNGRYPHCD
jgi:hypothetical protein